MALLNKKNVNLARFFFIFGLFFIVFSANLSAQVFHRTSFEDRQVCEETKGIWREFGNGCGDKCISKFDKFDICEWRITYACDCGKGRCWDGSVCIAMGEYEDVYAKQQEKERRIIEEAKQKRRIQALIYHKKRMLSLVDGARRGTISSQNAEGQEAVAPSNNFAQVYSDVTNGYDPSKAKQEFESKLKGQPVGNDAPVVVPVQQPSQPVKLKVINDPDTFKENPPTIPKNEPASDSGPTQYFLKLMEEQKKKEEASSSATASKPEEETKKNDSDAGKTTIPLPSVPGLPVIPLP